MGIGISLLGGFAVPIDGLCVIFRDPLSVFIADSEVVLGCCISLLGCFAVPVGGLCVIFRYPLAVLIAVSEVVLGCCMSLLGGFAVPVGGLCVIFRYPLAVLIAVSEVVLGCCMSLLGGFAVPVGGLCVIFRYPLAVLIAVSEVVLGCCMSLLGGFAVPTDGLCVIFCDPETVFIEDSEVILCCGITLLSRLAETVNGFGIILRHPVAVVIAQADVVECLGIVLQGEVERKYLPLFDGDALLDGGTARLGEGDGMVANEYVGVDVGGCAREDYAVDGHGGTTRSGAYVERSVAGHGSRQVDVPRLTCRDFDGLPGGVVRRLAGLDGVEPGRQSAAPPAVPFPLVIDINIGIAGRRDGRQGEVGRQRGPHGLCRPVARHGDVEGVVLIFGPLEQQPVLPF